MIRNCVCPISLCLSDVSVLAFVVGIDGAISRSDGVHVWRSTEEVFCACVLATPISCVHISIIITRLSWDDGVWLSLGYMIVGLDAMSKSLPMQWCLGTHLRCLDLRVQPCTSPTAGHLCSLHHVTGWGYSVAKLVCSSIS